MARICMAGSLRAGWSIRRKIETGSENVPSAVINVEDPFSRRLEGMRSGGLVELGLRSVSGGSGSDQLPYGREELRASFGHKEIASCGAGVLGQVKPGTPSASAEEFASLPLLSLR